MKGKRTQPTDRRGVRISLTNVYLSKTKKRNAKGQLVKQGGKGGRVQSTPNEFTP